MPNIMKNKKGIVLGVANGKSIAWQIAKKLKDEGAEIGYTYQDEASCRKALKLFEENNASFVCKLDVCDEGDFPKLNENIEKHFDGKLDFVVHSIAGGPSLENLQGDFYDISRENFLKTMEISAFSFVAIMKSIAPYMKATGNSSAICLSYLGAQRAVPNYNVMGVAKATLEACTRYMASDLGKDGIRVNVVSPGPVLTRAASAIGGFRQMLKEYAEQTPLGKLTDTEDVASAALYLLSDLSAGTTGQTLFVDGGYNIR